MDNGKQKSVAITLIAIFYLILGGVVLFIGYTHKDTMPIAGGVWGFIVGVLLLMRLKVGRFLALITAWLNVIYGLVGLITVIGGHYYTDNILAIVSGVVFVLILIVLQMKRYYVEFH